MDFILLELAQQVVNFLRLGNKIRRTDKALPSEVVRLRQIRQ